VDIIDAHHHLWDTTKLSYPLLKTIPPLHRPFLAREYDEVGRQNGVSHSVCVEVASIGADGWQETQWLLHEVDRSAIADRLVVWAPIERSDLSDYLRRVHALTGPIVAIRRSFEFEPPGFPSRPDVIAGVAQLEAYGYAFDLVLFHPSLAAVIELVRACPKVQFIFDHLGKPDIRSSMTFEWQRSIVELAALDNVVCKISGVVTEADLERWAREDLRPFIDHAIQSFGWERVMFGSDWPVCRLAGGYEKWLDAVIWATYDASTAEQEALFSGTARRVYYANRPLDDRTKGHALP
jgi:L-fuconolactonase